MQHYAQRTAFQLDIFCVKMPGPREEGPYLNDSVEQRGLRSKLLETSGPLGFLLTHLDHLDISSEFDPHTPLVLLRTVAIDQPTEHPFPTASDRSALSGVLDSII